MIKLVKGFLLILAVLISYINSGILVRNTVESSLQNIEGSYPSSDRFSIQNILVCPITDLNLKTNIAAGKSDRLFQKIKISWGSQPEILILKNHRFFIKSEAEDPSLVSDIFGPPDISFPFTSFW